MLKKVIITGPESTGKSTLSKALAKHYNTVWVPEYARKYINTLNRPYNKNDLLKIMTGQLITENQMVKEAKNILFCDTSLLVIKVWYEHKFGELPPILIEKLKKFSCDHFLLPNIDLPWVFDPQRENPDQRAFFFNIYRRELEQMETDFTIISGTGDKRIKSAIRAIDYLVKPNVKT